MTISYHGNGVYTGLAADNKATITNPITNALFIETDSGKISRYNGSAWVVGTVAVYNDQANTFTTTQTFNATTAHKLRSADGASFYYNINPGTVGADRNLVLPNMTSNDVMMVTAHSQTVTNKTMVLASNTITDTSAATGDTVRYNGTRFVRLAMGTANQVLATNSGATDIAYTTLNKDHIMPANNPIKMGRKYSMLNGFISTPMIGTGLVISLPASSSAVSQTPTSSMGRYMTYTTGATTGDNAGGNAGNVFMRFHNPYYAIRFRHNQTTDVRGWFGVSSDAGNMPTGDTYADSKSVFLFGWRTTDLAGNYQIIHNDGSASATYVDTGTAVSTALRTVELWGDETAGGWKWSINGGTVNTITTGTPA